jgi:ketopantoate reductase
VHGRAAGSPLCGVAAAADGVAAEQTPNAPSRTTSAACALVAPYCTIGQRRRRLPSLIAERVLSARLGSLLLDAKAQASMATDLRYRRPTEIAYLNGLVVQLGEQKGVATPLNARLYALVRAAEEAASGAPELTPAQIARGVDGIDVEGRSRWAMFAGAVALALLALGVASHFGLLP